MTDHNINTPEGRAALLELCEKATPGPWEHRSQSNSADARIEDYVYAAVGCHYHAPYRDVAFIVAARTALPAALAKLAELEAQLHDAEIDAAIKVNKELVRLEQELAALRADKERLDWIIETGMWCLQANTPNLWSVFVPGDQGEPDWKEVASGKTPREAIDQARATAAQEPTK